MVVNRAANSAHSADALSDSFYTQLSDRRQSGLSTAPFRKRTRDETLDTASVFHNSVFFPYSGQIRLLVTIENDIQDFVMM